MTLKVYNSLTREQEEFVPLEKNKVKMFVCGQTVYDDAHLGHAKTYVQFDIVVRWLRYLGYDVFYVQNITDVDDKIINRANERKMEPKELAEFYAKRFFEDMNVLGVKQSVSKFPKSSDFIKQIIEQIQSLIKKGYAYAVEGDVYFDVKKFADYSNLSRMNLKDLERHRIEPNPKKKNSYDFSLWKEAKKGEPYWEGEIVVNGKRVKLVGRPGWHIEDTAITVSLFGPQYDLHGGANELIFPHHTNEIAQAEAATGKKPFVKYWLHSGVLNIKGTKMSKSLGNFITIREVLKAYDAETLRLLYASTHYRSPIDFEDSMLEQAKAKLDSLYNILDNVKHRTSTKPMGSNEKSLWTTLQSIKTKFADAMNDDFNTALALSYILEISKEVNKLIDSESSISKELSEKVISLFKELGNIFGILQKEVEKEKLPKEILDMIIKREGYRKRGDFEAADRMRKELEKKGILVEDTPTGPRWKRIKP